MIVYREIAPPPELADWVQSLWELRGAAPVDPSSILPDGCLDLVFHLGSVPGQGGGSGRPRSHGVGPLLRPLELRLAGEVHAVGVCVRPGAGHAVLGVAAEAVADAAVPLDDLVGSGAARIEEAVVTAPEGRALAALAGALLGRWRGRAPDAACIEAARRLRALPGLPIPALAAAIGLSVRQLERRFRRHVGLTPKAFARVARFDRVVRLLGPGRSLAELALDCGYADQAHFNHEFRALAGHSPGAHVAFRQYGPTGPP